MICDNRKSDNENAIADNWLQQAAKNDLHEVSEKEVKSNLAVGDYGASKGAVAGSWQLDIGPKKPAVADNDAQLNMLATRLREYNNMKVRIKQALQVTLDILLRNILVIGIR